MEESGLGDLGDVLVEREVIIKKDTKVAAVRRRGQGEVIHGEVEVRGSLGEGIWTND